MTGTVATPTGKPNSTKLPTQALREKRRRIRTLKDTISRIGITAAGYGVVLSLALIFLYLLYEVLPILKGANIEPVVEYSVPAMATGDALTHLVMERYQELGVSYSEQGRVTFFDLNSGSIRTQLNIPFHDNQQPTSFAAAEYI